ncbi:hypothetical protein C8N43_2192 [Litoreibacter ponti]|uniref:Uncharacterized protein n=1 Tax=Litoreibacter ponti TaxID=1510457 RepID=A0A2T6BN98_9RHOB|nr:hypothetical protein [Litoreibacter ponti]PTX57522.1 hypothetical protein C8N43_2192 [Litoreibacter ponti]
MARFLPYLNLLILVACGAPSMGVIGGQSERVTVGDYVFEVNFKGSRAEAYRTNTLWAPKARQVFAAGATAMEQVTGCHVVRSSVRGDVALVQADLLC